jgi:transcription factor CP2-like protein
MIPLIKMRTENVCREGKSSEDELKAWQFWHGRQHSVKQRILDPDQKNSTGEQRPILNLAP